MIGVLSETSFEDAPYRYFQVHFLPLTTLLASVHTPPELFVIAHFRNNIVFIFTTVPLVIVALNVAAILISDAV